MESGPVAEEIRPLWPQGPAAVPLGVGTWAWGDRTYWGYGTDYNSTDVEHAYEAARAAGVRLFDTAEVYGEGTSEWLLGQFLAEHDDRETALVATKFAALPWRVGRRGVLLKALEESLKRLRLTRVALYQIHWSLPVLSDKAWLRDLAVAVERGLIGAVGVSNYGTKALATAYNVLADLGVTLATNQVQYSLLARKIEANGLLAACRDRGVTVLAYSPLAQGLLTGKYSPTSRPPGVRGMRQQRELSDVGSLVTTMREIGEQQGGRTPTQVALNWLICKGTVPIPGAKNAGQAAQNAGALGWRLTEDQVRRLDRSALE